MIRILANPRSGTLSTAKSLQALGLDIQHERIGKDGTVSCFFYIDSDYYPKGNEKVTRKFLPHEGEGVPSDYNWKINIHLVREPVACISSMYTIIPGDHRQWLLDIGVIKKNQIKPKIVFCMNAYYEQNKIFEKICKYRIRLEDKGKMLMKILGLKGKYPDLHERNTHTPPQWRVQFDWDKLFSSDYLLAEKIRQQAKKYGYDVPQKTRKGIMELI